MERKLWTCDMGSQCPYQKVEELQRELVERLVWGEVPDVLLLLEHEPTITVGRSGGLEDLMLSPELVAKLGVQVCFTNRGGKLSYHGPGVLVGYPILNLKQHRPDVNWYLRQLEEVLVQVLFEFGIAASRRQGLTGVWVQDRKIASIGIAVRRWVTHHGFALNVCPDMSYFRLIRPCGLPGESVTSMIRELRHTTFRIGSKSDEEALMARVKGRVTEKFAERFNLAPEPIALSNLTIRD